MAAGTALNEGLKEALVVAFCASADGAMTRLPSGTPTAIPTANANTMVIVLLMALLRDR
jgi:hypothetical protein